MERIKTEYPEDTFRLQQQILKILIIPVIAGRYIMRIVEGR